MFSASRPPPFGIISIDLAAYPPLPAIERALAALGQRLTLTVEAAE
jgi:hypothetical protein